MISKNVLMKKPIWLRTWDYSTLFFVNKPSPYFQNLLPTYYPKLGKNNVIFLDQKATILD
jgi:hypothetical protein